MYWSTVISVSVLASFASALVQSPVKGPLKGFNYNPGDDAATLFALVKNELPKIGAPGFASARLYTALDPGSKNPIPHAAFKAAGDTKTSVLIGLAASLGDDSFNDELTALTSVLQDKDGTYGNLLSQNLIVGISVGNEDLYRQSLQGTPMAKTQGAGSKPATIMKQINLVRQTLSQQKPSLLKKIPVGHADTWRMWTDKDYGLQLLSAQPKQDNFQPIDFIGMQAFNYWEGYDIHNLSAYRTEALASVKAVAGKIPIWATETGWPVDGPKCCGGPPNNPGMPGYLAYTGKDEAQIYWKGIGCETLFAGTGSDARNTWWYRLFASPGKSATADGNLDWKVLSSITGNDTATAAFPLQCDAVAPSVPTATPAKSAGKSKSAAVTIVLPGWLALLPSVLLLLVTRLVG